MKMINHFFACHCFPDKGFGTFKNSCLKYHLRNINGKGNNANSNSNSNWIAERKMKTEQFLPGHLCSKVAWLEIIEKFTADILKSTRYFSWKGKLHSI